MLTVDEALRLVLEQARPLPAQTVPLEHSLGLVLAEAVTSDVDSPPYDKSIVDGYAVQANDLANGEARLAILEEVVAGGVPSRPVRPGTTTRLMTGAPLPAGADAVVMIEHAEAPLDAGANGHTVLLREPKRIAAGQNVMRRAASVRKGEIVLQPGASIRPIEIGLLAEVGRAAVRVVRRPSVAILPTGNELVPPEQTPGPGQIRNSNGPMLTAAVARAGGAARELPIARDDREQLRRSIAAGLESDVLVLSGGVSAGVMDLVPAVLAELGVRQVFHKLRLKPGKPLWFGVYGPEGEPAPDDGGQRLVFGLPGNPVSSLVCFELFVRPALGRLAGGDGEGLPRVHAKLAREFVHRGDRPTYHPSVLSRGPADTGDRHVEPVTWHGSADLRALAAANALALFPAGSRTHAAGEIVEVLLL
jgi:molybdopterin molybdotransferase